MNGSNEAEKIVRSAEIVTGGARLSPYEDFKLRTLPALEGLWSKLLYMAELRSSNGKYEHWGHSRIHGEEPSQETLARIHSELYIEFLRTPLRELIPENAIALSQIEKQMSAAVNKLIPADGKGGSVRHFNSIVLAVRLLGDARAVANRSVA